MINKNSDAKIETSIFIIVAIICYSISIIGLSNIACKNDAYNEYKREICQVISITAEEYINCNTMEWEDILRKIPKVKDGE